MKALRMMICLLALVIAAPTVQAQKSSKELKKELKAKVDKDSKKTAKQLKKEGWKVMPGKLPLEKQIQESRYAELDTDENGDRLYIIGTHQATGGNYSAAKQIADSRARMEIASQVNTMIAQRIDDRLATSDYGDGDMETIGEVVSAGQGVVSAQLQGIIPVLEIYKEGKNNTCEVKVVMKINQKNALKAARAAYRNELRKKSETLAEDLDKLLPVAEYE